MAQHCLRCCLDRHSLRDGPLKTADAIAMKLGINKTAMIRVRAGNRAVWRARNCDDYEADPGGHSVVPRRPY
jgi:hypothetical protein